MRRLVLLLPLAAVAIAGCASAGGASGGRPLVVATTTQLGDFAREVGGSAIDVHQVLRPNTDPHEYEPRPSDVSAAAGAKLVVLSGNRLDSWMGKVLKNAGGSPTVVTIAPAHLTHPLGTDPHWWHDPRNAEAAVAAIRAALVRVDPRARATFTRNAARYEARLRSLDAGIAKCFAAIPAARRRLVTDHDAFGYFARRYGISVIGAVIPSQTTQAQASAGATARLAGLIRKEHVRAVFPESSINAKLAEALARETGARSDFTLYGDTLGPSGSPGATYLGMERANADRMIRGFTGGARGCGVK